MGSTNEPCCSSYRVSRHREEEELSRETQSVVGVVLAGSALTPIRNDELGVDDLRIVAELHQFSGPVVRAGTGFHGDKAAGQLCE